MGDIILARVNRAKLERIPDREDFIIVEDVHHQIQDTRKAGTALWFFPGLIVAAITGLADIMVCAPTSASLLAITGCLHLRDACREPRDDVLLVIVATIAPGAAMPKTGASEVYARAFLRLIRDGGARARQRPSWCRPAWAPICRATTPRPRRSCPSPSPPPRERGSIPNPSSSA
ncbi:MAG: hypothetical protein ACLFTV_02590 [Desulfococcaceae bacterium]